MVVGKTSRNQERRHYPEATDPDRSANSKRVGSPALYLEQKELYETEVRKALVESWKGFCRRQDKEGVWEGVCRILGRATAREEDQLVMEGGKYLDAKGSAELARVFYPNLEEEDEVRHRRIRVVALKEDKAEDHHDNYPPFQVVELLDALHRFNPKKAPGSNGLTAGICSHAIETDPALFLGLLNYSFLHHGYFPKNVEESHGGGTEEA